MNRFDGDTDVITLCIDKVIELGFWNIYFEFVNDGNFEGLVTGVQYGINYDTGWCVNCWLGTGFHGATNVIALSINKLIRINFKDRSYECCD